MNVKKIIAVVLVFTLAFSISAPCQTARASTPVDLSVYVDRNFYGESAAEPIHLNEDCSLISFYAISDGDEIDNLTCCIRDDSHNGLNSCTFNFNADGSTTTVSYYLPAGRYTIYFTGNSDILKTYGCALFSAVE